MENHIYQVRQMKEEDYDKVHALWMGIHGFGIRSMDDSMENVCRFLRRNPTTSIVACAGEKMIGSILCGHDGRRGSFYHVCVDEAYRKHGIGKAMVEMAVQALTAEGINKVTLIAFDDNEVGNKFWKDMGWTFRNDVNYYEYTLNENNITKFNP